MNECSPIVIPHTIVALAPIVAPFRTRVLSNFRFLRGKAERGLMTLVKTQDGPQKTQSSITTPSYTDTLFCIFTLLPISAVEPTKTFWPILHSLPIFAPDMIWEKCHILVPSPMLAGSSTTAVSWTKYSSCVFLMACHFAFSEAPDRHPPST